MKNAFSEFLPRVFATTSTFYRTNLFSPGYEISSLKQIKSGQLVWELIRVWLLLVLNLVELLVSWLTLLLVYTLDTLHIIYELSVRITKTLVRSSLKLKESDRKSTRLNSSH